MKTSNKGKQLITRLEGEILYVYLDPIGLPTLGVGHLLTAAELKMYPVGTKISRELSQQFLADDLLRFEKALDELVTVPLNQNQYDACISLMFNIGVGSSDPKYPSGFTRSTVRRKLNEKDYDGAARAFMSWVKAGGRVLPGLVARRDAERKLFLAPVQKAASNVTDVPAPGDGGTQTKPSEPSPDPINSINASGSDEKPARTHDKEEVSKVVDGYMDLFLHWVDRFADTQTKVTRSTWLVTMFARLGGLISLVTAFFADNWEITLIGVVLIIAASVYIRYHKRQVKKAALRSE